MSVGSFRSLALADLARHPQAVGRLIDEGETSIVERKEAIPQGDQDRPSLRLRTPMEDGSCPASRTTRDQGL